MAQQRAIRLSLQKPTHAVCVVGTDTSVDIYGSVPSGAVTFKVTGSSTVQTYLEYDPENVSGPPADEYWPLNADVDVIISMEAASKSVDDAKVRVSYYGKDKSNALGQALLYLTGIEVSLDVDIDRTGAIKRSRDDKVSFSSSKVLPSFDVPCSKVLPVLTFYILRALPAWTFCVVRISPNFDPTFFPSWPNLSLDRETSQAEFLDAMTYLALQANCQLIICPPVDNRNDRWIQDEMEFGYIEAPHKSFPVVFDSPRNRGLRNFPFKRVLGPDFGYVTREPAYGGASSLDSFGNLDVSPPVTVRGKEYPLGRILIGSSFPKSGGRRMAKVVRNFLYAQKVQDPVELYSDWLSVGHVDEFLSFVPAPGQKGFRLLLASPNACFKLFQEKKDEGHGTAAQFEGLKKGKKKITIDEMLNDKSLRSDNRYAQKCIDWNREVLKRELGLSERDIIDIPQLFKLSDSYAEAFFPDMVNMIVLGKFLGIPKPFGPIINGRCCLEEKVQDLLRPLGLKCTFIDDYLSYHVLMGEIHCGTNVRRKPFSFKWWNMIP
ncbi:protein-arginine deiminase type-1-like [Petaurus breviceps papuanus]|uniref:protein-arginine deiminase type-1-like n=1 Tax=Petaurus breviceps papuanus TaxID=3040969 RepID=UPI0036DA96FA